jgi:PAS domain S-box-containing protein
MKKKWILNFSALVLVCIFTTFVVGVDRYAENNARANMENHARVVSDDLWNFNVRGITDYLTLAADSYGYQKLVVTDFKGQLFWSHQDRNLGWITEKLIRLNLITKKRLVAPVMYGDMMIGAVEADWLNKTVFLKAYLFFALVLIYVVIFLYTRIVGKKQTLEENVRIRTHELLDANQSLKQEIEERKRMEEALRESEKKHRFLAENINDVIWTMDLSMKYTYVSPVSSKLHGWSEEELNHLTIEDTLTPESLQTAKHVLGEQLRLAEETGDYNRSVTLILETNSKDGSTLWCEVIASCIVDENKKPLCIMGVTRNITERMRTQRERDMLQKQLERSKKMESLGILAGGVAHDLNNVLSGIVSYPELLLLDLPPESSLYAPIRVIRDSGLKAAAIVEDLLTLARRGVTAHETISLKIGRASCRERVS